MTAVLAPTIARLSDPGGPVNDPGGLCYTAGLAFDPSGRYLAQVVYASGRGRMTVPLYRRDGDRLTKLATADWQAEQGQPSCCWWDRTGRWLIVSSTGAQAYGTDPGEYRLWLYQRDGDTFTPAGNTGPVNGIYDHPGSLAFDPTGRWVALSTPAGVGGLAQFNPAGGAITPADTALNAGGSAQFGLAAAWHPTDTTLLISVSSWGQLEMWRRNGSGLDRLDPAAVPATTTGSLTWHPDGTGMYVDDQFGGGAYGMRHLTYPPLAPGDSPGELGQLYNGYAIDPYSGRFLAGGPGTTSSGYACGPAEARGLSIEVLRPGGAPGGTLSAGQDTETAKAYGDVVTWAPGDTPGTSYLAASVSSWTYSDPSGTDPWGVRLYRLGFGPATVSDLYARRPDGAFALVGVTGQPLTLRLPDGSTRQWPGSSYPLYVRRGDGTWAKVIG